MKTLQTIKSRIFFKISILCLCSILLVLNIYTNKNFITIIGITLCIFMLVRGLNKEFTHFEDQVIENCLEAQHQPTHKEIIDAEYFTVVD